MTFKDIDNKPIAVHCWKRELRHAILNGNDEGYIEEGCCDSILNYYSDCTERCFRILNGKMWFGTCDYYHNEGFKIIEFTDFIKEDFEIMDKLWLSTTLKTNDLNTLEDLVRTTLVNTLPVIPSFPTQEIEIIKNSLYKKSLTIMPKITKIEVKNETVVIMTFADGTTEKAVTSPEDTFSLEQGISICITKKLLSMLSRGNGSSLYNKIVHKALKLYNDEQAEAAQKEELKQIEIDRAERLAAKRAKRKAKYEAKKREREISVQAEAYARALRMVNQGENK